VTAEFAPLLEHIAQPARLEADEFTIEGSEPLPNLPGHNVRTLLPHWSILQVAGPDAGKFLQGQLTCDIDALTAATATPGAHCTPKGRMLSSFLVAHPQPDTYWLRVRTAIRDSACAALAKYIVFSKAKLQAQTPLVAIGLSGPDAAAAVRRFASDAPASQYGVTAAAGGVIVQLDAVGQRFEAWLPQDAALALWQQCGDFEVAGSAFWRWLDIHAGWASVEAGTVEAFIPQMLNYDRNGAVSFSKGCYTGQEIVARAHYRGQVKRHLLQARAAAPAPLAGSDVAGADGRALGQIAAAVDRGDGYCDVLLVAAGDAADRPPLFLPGSSAAGGVPLQLL
jgi:folate-binding protein YgfZ